MSIPEETYEENGRLYHRWQKGVYWLPHDEDELERLDVLHGLTYNLDKLALPLHRSPLVPEPGQPVRILDLGCGTGFWAMEMADRYTSAEVIGTDLINCQPAAIPANVSFRPHCNFNDRFWPFGEESFDLIHLGQITATSVNWREMYGNVKKYLRPRFGHIEQLDFDIAPHIAQGARFPPRSNIEAWWRDLVKASADGGRPIAYDERQVRAELEIAGFQDITHEKIPIPWHYYRTPGENYQIGGTFQVTMVQGVGFDAYCMAPFSRVNQWTKEQITEYLTLLKREIFHTDLQIFSYFHLWTARKP
ncbi:S-adenosyl-L-methionine-dependent methyltransferase [Elsinoe ampelina]|uniref:S-adenosyl-L-methionine-dependent methyltransferase n=1 Tax=Elsinoe ampelina TaxID=302913 RepID=A0A6A6FZB3_9PEZI|nr:S-adenosyl-L-methionine-dependent methyltransferase [Elsinoe ampelina]